MNPPIKKISYPLLLSCAILLLFILTIIFLKQYSHIRNAGNFHVRQTRSNLTDVNKIQKWMTFDYINRSFVLPPEYLKNELTIISDDYPKITLTKASLLKGEAPDKFIEDVKVSVQKYIDINKK